MDKITRSILPIENGGIDFRGHKRSAASPLPVGNATNSADAPARPVSPEKPSAMAEIPQTLNADAKRQVPPQKSAPASPGKKLKPAETSPLPAASAFASERGLITPTDVKKTAAILPGAPRAERQETDSSFAHNLRSQKRLFADYPTSGGSPAVPDNTQTTAESKKPR